LIWQIKTTANFDANLNLFYFFIKRQNAFFPAFGEKHQAFWTAFSKAASAAGKGARLRARTPCRKEMATP
jgi:hypothetical protein